MSTNLQVYIKHTTGTKHEQGWNHLEKTACGSGHGSHGWKAWRPSEGPSLALWVEYGLYGNVTHYHRDF